RAECEIDIPEGSQVHDRLFGGKGPEEEENAADDHNAGQDEDGFILKPVIAWAFFQNIFHRAEECGHAEKAPPVELAQKGAVAFIEVDEVPCGDGNEDAGADIDEKQPVP